MANQSHPLTDGAKRVPQTFFNVQALRGIAASMVVIFHSTEKWSELVSHGSNFTWFAGASGVDMFFVISGFVMAISTIGKGSGPRAAGAFIERRLVRILPFYWAVTTFLLLKIDFGFVRDPFGLRHVPWGYALTSYLLIPSRAPGGGFYPLAGQGWTLMYEMFFYWCMALAIGTRRNLMIVLTCGLGLLAVVGYFRPENWPAVTILASPLLLEFLAGLWLGWFVMRRGGFGPRVGIAALIALAALALAPGAAHPIFPRLGWGVGGVLAVLAAVSLEGTTGSRIPRWLLLIGDASYSVYLTHPMMLNFYALVLEKVHIFAPKQVTLASEIEIVLIFLALSTLLGILTYKLVESPLNRFFRRLLHLRRPVQTEAAAAR